ncbi:MAG TPA: thioesterase family protein [Edaphocola sp.]|nr:thioesterase family protein [Edaphocola sp.]
METKKIYLHSQVLWSMIDINGHLRHSAYADLAAQARVNVLVDLGLDKAAMKLGLGPILFREELVYHKEIKPNDMVSVSVALKKFRQDGKRYTLVSEIYNAAQSLCATVTVDGAWLDIKTRKLAALPQELNDAFVKIPRTEDFLLEAAPEE